MNPEFFDFLVQAAAIIVAVLGAFAVVPAVGWLKERLGLSGAAVQILAVVIAGIWGAAEVLVGGQIGAADIAWSNLPALVALVWGAAEARYRMLQQGSK